MMAFAWIIIDELQLLESFGHVIFIDTTEKLIMKNILY